MIKGKLVVLAPFEKEDLCLTLKWLNDLGTALSLGKAYPFNLSDSEAWFHKNVSQNKVLILKIMVGNQHIGNVTLDEFAPVERMARFSIYIGEAEYRGRGYARDASVAMLRYGLTSPTFTRAI